MPRLEMAETKPVEVTEKWQMGNERFTQRATYGWENLPFDSALMGLAQGRPFDSALMASLRAGPSTRP